MTDLLERLYGKAVDLITRAPASQPLPDLLYPGDLVWIILPASDDDWFYEEYAEASLLVDTDPANNRGLVAFFNFEVKQISYGWFSGAHLERRSESEGVFTFDRVWMSSNRTAA